jgi:hypothetical protein
MLELLRRLCVGGGLAFLAGALAATWWIESSRHYLQDCNDKLFKAQTTEERSWAAARARSDDREVEAHSTAWADLTLQRDDVMGQFAWFERWRLAPVVAFPMGALLFGIGIQRRPSAKSHE